MKNILFLCTGNSCRSQMSEALAKKHFPAHMSAYSAGTKAQGLNPYAMQSLEKKDIDISSLRSKSLDDLKAEFPQIAFSLVVTLCGDAAETCPVFMGARTVHHGFDDPPQITKNMDDEQEIIQVYDDVCDEIESFITEMPKIYPEVFSEKE